MEQHNSKMINSRKFKLDISWVLPGGSNRKLSVSKICIHPRRSGILESTHFCLRNGFASSVKNKNKSPFNVQFRTYMIESSIRKKEKCMTYENVQDHMKKWLFENLNTKYVSKISNMEKMTALNRILMTYCFEHFYLTKYTTKINNLFECEIIIPALCTLIDRGIENAADTFLIGSPQVNKIRKIARLMNIPPEQIVEHILDCGNESGDPVSLILNDSVHKKNPNIYLIGSINSSTVYPLLLGKSKALQILDKDIDHSRVWSICCHTFSEINNKNIYPNIIKLSNIPEYYCGGTIHIIINNEIEGFGTPRCETSCKFLKQLAEHLKAPIVHVQAEDVATVINAMMFGADYRANYKKDVMIDLMCSTTKSTTANEQLFLSGLLKSFITGGKFPLVTTFMNELIEDELISKSKCDDKRTIYVKKLNKMYVDGKKPSHDRRNLITNNSLVDTFSNNNYKEPVTGMSVNAVHKIFKAISAKPPFSICLENFKLLEKRKELIEQNKMDWEMCETLAYTSLLKEGIDIHISRSKGKHNPRFLIKNLENDELYNQVEHIFPYMGKYEVSEHRGPAYGMAGFEIGYSSMNTNTLNIWEVSEMITSQQFHNIFKEFFQLNNYERINNCVVTFITPTYFKVKSKTTDSYCSAQPQKIIESCCESNVSTNMIEQLFNTNAIVANVSTPANFYHLLKRQAISSIQRPLILFTPNNFEMSDRQCSKVQDITRDTSFQVYISDELFTNNNTSKNNEIKDLILCSGAMYYTLLEERSKRKLENQIPISRIEQIHPFPYSNVLEDIQRFPNANIWWAQEEDFLHGWWNFIESRLTALFGNKIKIKYAGRRKLVSKICLTTKISNEDLTYIFNCLEEN